MLTWIDFSVIPPCQNGTQTSGSSPPDKSIKWPPRGPDKEISLSGASESWIKSRGYLACNTMQYILIPKVPTESKYEATRFAYKMDA